MNLFRALFEKVFPRHSVKVLGNTRLYVENLLTDNAKPFIIFLRDTPIEEFKINPVLHKNLVFLEHEKAKLKVNYYGDRVGYKDRPAIYLTIDGKQMYGFNKHDNAYLMEIVKERFLRTERDKHRHQIAIEEKEGAYKLRNYMNGLD